MTTNMMTFMNNKHVNNSYGTTNHAQRTFVVNTYRMNHPREWPPRSPDLTPCDFFLREYINSKVYVNSPANLNDLRARITRAFEDLKRDPDIIRRAMQEMVNREQVCIERDGRNVEGNFR